MSCIRRTGVLRTALPAAGPRAAAGGLAVLAALLLLVGCVEVEDDLTLHADGSGRVRIRTTNYATSMMGMKGGMLSGPPGTIIYPPINQQEAAAFFPGDAFEVEVDRSESVDDATVTTVSVAFKDMDDLLRTPYAEAHALRVEKQGEEIVVKSRTGLQKTAHAEAFVRAPKEQRMPVSVDFEKLAGSYERLAVRFSITLPGPAHTSTEGAEVDGKTVRLAIARKGCDSPEVSAKAFDAVLTATCSADGVTFDPNPPLRLDLEPFASAPTGSVAEAEAVDVAKVLAASDLVPVALTVTRSFDLAGYDFWGENGCELRVAVMLPPRLAPHRWGEPTLLEAVDDLGTDLVPTKADSRHHHISYSPFSGREEPRSPDGRFVHPVVFELAVPRLDARRIARLKGRIDLEYAGAKEVVRIPDALRAEHIQEVDIGPGVMGQEGQEVAVESPRLEVLGLALKIKRAAQAPGLMMVNLQAEAEDAYLSKVQFFEADGRPVPAVANRSEHDGRVRVQLLLLGTPKPPLAMAVLVAASGPTVPLPLELKEVPIRDDPKSALDAAKE